MAVAGPFYLAMVDETETTFGSGHHRMDEYVFSARRILSEGEKPKLELVIENPRVGLLSPLRKQWCWFAWDSNWGGTPNIIPLFFGRLVGIPSDLQAETLTITFIAWPSNYVKQLQALAETLKVSPFYDPVFTDVSKRDDPMTIFESHSKLVCVNPVTHVVSASDILDAEDGNVDFTANDHFYDSLHVSPGAVPKTAIYVDASVSWTQTARGYVDMGNNIFSSYSGDGIMSEWPKPLSAIGPGLTVFVSLATDVNRTADIVTSTFSGSWTNREKHHNDGDALSFSWNWTVPQIHGDYKSRVITYTSQTGFLDPFGVDADGDPSPTNIPASVSVTTAYVPLWTVRTSLVLEYQAARPHTERVVFRLFANVQPTTLDPNVSEDSETITISGSDVGVPIIDLLNWTTISGTHVNVGTVIFPDDPQLPGGRSAQRATVAGTAGTVEPTFGDVVGDVTIDGGVTWVSLGIATPTESAPDWTGVSNVPAGTMILPRRPIYTTYAAFTAAGLLQFPPVGTPISEGTILQDGAVFKVCTVSGTVGATTGDTATLVTLSTLPDGKTYFIATTGGITGARYVIPNFNNTQYATTSDGSVVWTAIGSGEIPIGGTPGNVLASTYFGQDRGHRSIEHLICRARTRLRYASRAVTSQFQCSYLRGTELTLRKSATLHDYRLPGGLILGKVTGIEMVANGGTFTSNVTIQSSVGLGETVTEVPGDPTYVLDGYVAEHYQVRTNVIVLLPTLSDVGYSPLVPTPDEDGIQFPLQKPMLVVSESFVDGGGDAVEDGLDAMVAASVAQNTPSSGTLLGDEAKQRAIAIIQTNNVTEQLKRHPSWYDLVLKPINGNGAFNHVYHIKCTTLALPKMIDLQEEEEISPPVSGSLSPTFVSDSSIFYSPTSTGGDYTLVPERFISTDTFAVPSIAGGSGGSSSIPMSLSDPRFSANTASAIDPVGTVSNKDWDDSPSYTDGDPCWGWGSGVVNVNQCRIDWREGPRLEASSGALTLSECYIHCVGFDTDHADAFQAFGQSGGTFSLTDSYVRAHTPDEAFDLYGGTAAGSTCFFWADNCSGTIQLQNVILHGGDRMFTANADPASVIHIDFDHVYFVVEPGYPETWLFNSINTGGTLIVDQWNEVREASIVGGVLVPGSLIPSP